MKRPIKYSLFLVLSMLLSMLIILIGFILKPSVKSIININCDLDILDGVIEKYECYEEDDNTKNHYIIVKIPGNHVEELTKQLESKGYNNEFYIHSITPAWWPDSKNNYYKYYANRIFGLIRINTCANTVSVNISEKGDTYLYISCIEMGNLWINSGIA